MEALTHFGVEPTQIKLVGTFTNILYRARATDGTPYALRICSPAWRTPEDTRSEVMWLQALADEPDIPAPVPVLTLAGEPYALASGDGIPEPRRCTLTSWLPGTPLGRRLTPENLVKMGALFARLHRHGAAFSPPIGFTTRRMASYIARDEADVLFSDACLAAMDAHTRDVLLGTRDIVLKAFEDLYADPTDLRVIHNDLWHDNIKVYRGRLYPLDFEDTVWGYPVQDLAMALQDLITDVAPGLYEPYARALREGYQAIAAWPEAYSGQIDQFRAGRILWVANYVATFQEQHIDEHLTRLTPQLERFLDTGEIRKAATHPS